MYYYDHRTEKKNPKTFTSFSCIFLFSFHRKSFIHVNIVKKRNLEYGKYFYVIAFVVNIAQSLKMILIDSEVIRSKVKVIVTTCISIKKH